jgi:hypothetical protein
MKSLLIKDLSRSDDLDRGEMRAVLGGESRLAGTPEPAAFCGTVVPTIPALPALPSFPNVPAWSASEPLKSWQPGDPCGPAIEALPL